MPAPAPPLLLVRTTGAAHPRCEAFSAPLAGGETRGAARELDRMYDAARRGGGDARVAQFHWDLFGAHDNASWARWAALASAGSSRARGAGAARRVVRRLDARALTLARADLHVSAARAEAARVPGRGGGADCLHWEAEVGCAFRAGASPGGAPARHKMSEMMLWWIALLLNTIEAEPTRSASAEAAHAEPRPPPRPSEGIPGRAGWGLLRGLLASASIIGSVWFYFFW